MDVVKGVCPGCGCTVYLQDAKVADVRASSVLSRCPADGAPLRLTQLGESPAPDVATRLLDSVFADHPERIMW